MFHYLSKLNTVPAILTLFLSLYFITTISLWKKYDFHPSSMVNFGKEFADLNSKEVPTGAVVLKGYEGDLGAGYDGQIFYYYSRTISNFSNNWPTGFDESYRAPRIGYPFLISIFGLLGKDSAIFGMYFLNLSLFILSVFALRDILEDKWKPLAILYLLSPFSLGSYSVLVSDSVMVSLVVLAYYFYLKQRYLAFVLLSSLAILTKEPSLFLFFPLGISALFQKDWKKIFLVSSILLLPALWYIYLKITFPNWRPSRLTDFILPLEGILSYLKEILAGIEQGKGGKDILRLLSRFPLLILLVVGLFVTFTGSFKKGYVFRIGLLFTFFMIGVASHYHFWSVYDNVSRMFTISIPLAILLKQEDENSKVEYYLYFSLLVLFLFLVKVILIQKAQPYSLGI